MRSDSVPNREMVVYALYLLSGELQRVHTEDIARKCHELDQASFSWTKYPEYPDKDIVRVALFDARKETYGSLVDDRSGQTRGAASRARGGSGVDGWRLTPAGAVWIRDNLPRIERALGAARPKEHRQVLLKQLKRVRQHRLFAEFQESPDGFAPNIGHIASVLRCRVDAPPEVWASRFEKLRTKAEVAEAKDVIGFVEKCARAYDRQRPHGGNDDTAHD